MADITLTINGFDVTVPEGSTIMEAADEASIHIPRLCYHPKLSIQGACRVCVVEVEGSNKLVASCCYPAEDGMAVRTNTPEILRLRRDIVELLIDNHPEDCNTCERDGNCELQRLARDMGIRERLFAGERKRYEKDLSSPALIRDPEKCVLCGRCVRICGEVQEAACLSQVHRGFETVVMPAHDAPFAETVCIGCGQCAKVCPTAAFVEKDGTRDFLRALEDPEMIVVTQTAPAVRSAIGEEFGFEPGVAWEGKMFAAQRRLGVDVVFDTQFAADLTIMEEAAEFVHRFTNDGPLPNITSCCPGWIKYAEHFHPDLLPHLSTAKSPMSMQGAMIKSYWAEKMDIDPARIYSVAIMPCTAKKFEAEREELGIDGLRTVDCVLTTREFAWVMKHMGIDFATLPEEEPDSPLGESTGAAAIFGATVGVTEAALRTAYNMVFGEDLHADAIEFREVRGLEGLRFAEVPFGEATVRIALAYGLGAANEIFDRLQRGEIELDFVEVMACPGGCIGGGGQPYEKEGEMPLDEERLRLRAQALYNLDDERAIRCSHQNPDITRIYDEYLGEPNSHRAHELLHTYYFPRMPLGIRPQEAQV